MKVIRDLVPSLPRKAWVLLGGDALSAVGSGLTLPFLLVYLHRVRGMDLGVAGLAVSTIALASLAGNPVGGWLADRIGSRRTLMFGLVMAAAGTASVVAVHSPWQAFAAAAVLGFGGGIVWPSQDALMAVVVGPEQRPQVFAVRHATLNAGFAVGGVAAALIVSFGRSGSFVLIYLLDAASFLAFVPILRTLRGAGERPPAREPRLKGEGYRSVLRDPIFVRLWALTALLILAGYGQYHVAFAAYATGPGGQSARVLGAAFAANTLTVVMAQLVVLRLMNGRRRTRGVILVCAVWAAAWAVTLISGAAGTGLAGAAGFALAMVIFAVGETLLSPTIPAIVNDVAPEHLRGRYNGAYTLAWTTGFLLGPAIGGLAVAAGHGRTLFLVLIAALGMAAMAAGRLERRLPASANIVAGNDRPQDGPMASALEPALSGGVTA